MPLKPKMTGDLAVPMPLMHVLSINVGRPRQIMWRGQRVITSIYKEPVAGPIQLDPYNLAGDQQADLSVHGGPDKAVYVYPAVYYSEWAQELPGIDLPWGMFGENLTLSGVTDQTVYIGDRYQIGSAEVIVTQPRLPCYKLGIRFGRDSFVKQFLKSRRTGFYFALVRSGEIAAGDAALLLARDPQPLSVADVVRLYAEDRDDIDGLRRAVAVAALPTAWRDAFQARLERLQTEIEPSFCHCHDSQTRCPRSSELRGHRVWLGDQSQTRKAAAALAPAGRWETGWGAEVVQPYEGIT